ncbi:MAG: RagB/SusD family nutrient uptake outer membrane protein [Bacteroidales bacterium]|nr:RagB/SusD family nutrient uptake outer membrane protein [Bacteroidales bacterium]
MKKIIITLSLSCVLAACNGFLDMTPRDSISDKVMWATTESAEYAVNSVYSYTYDIFANWPSQVGMTEAFTDQMKYGSYNNFAYAYIPSRVAYGGADLTSNFVSVYLGCWGTLYGAVRRTNEAISNLKSLGSGLPAADQTRLMAELRLMRGWLYFELMKRYKEVIIYDEDLTKIEIDKALSSEEAGWDFVLADLQFSADNLPAKAAARGRLDNGAANALIARSMLYAERWNEVIAAVETLEGLGYGLADDYASVFTVSGNQESILQYNFSYSDAVYHSFDYYYTPGGDYKLVDQQGGGYGTPTQEMVESYELSTGGFPDWSPWHTSTTAEPPYKQLEPRFQATILYNGANWKERKIEPFVGGVDGWCQWNKEPQPQGRTTTGYYLRKFVDENHDLAERTQSIQHFVVLRYGEALLNKAEACYRSNDPAGANAAVKAIRSRVGLPYSDKSGDALWQAIRQERRIELAYEGLWYWDLRRWKEAAEAYPVGLNGYQVHGLKIEPTAVDGQYLYTYVSVDDQDRNFPSKMYRFPMPESELSSNALVEQYPEWR